MNNLNINLTSYFIQTIIETINALGKRKEIMEQKNIWRLKNESNKDLKLNEGD